jgi:hypothetical protein
VRWQTVILDLPDDGAGAMPLLRGVILRQEKSATYKLGLLRCVARIADVSPNVAVDAGDDVALPLGLVALYWLRLYKPLLEAGLPQLPGRSKPAFQNEDFAALQGVAPFDLRPGASFAPPLAAIVARSIRDCARLIASMPARHLTYTDDRPVFVAAPASARIIPRGALRLDTEWLASVGTFRVPGHVWHAMRRFAAWIEPMLVAEWVRLVQGYVGLDAPAQGASIHAALRWVEQRRDTSLAREIALARLKSGGRIACVWSGRPLAPRSLDIDHCLPWTAWPCSDLWNLLPSSPPVNQNAKREHLVSAEALRAAKPAILDWWRNSYAEGPPGIRLRFAEEARSSLPVTRQAGGLDLDDVFDALDFRRLRLRQEVDLKEWPGLRSG